MAWGAISGLLAFGLSLALTVGMADAREDASDIPPPNATYWFQEAWGEEGAFFKGTVEWSRIELSVPGIRAVVRLPEKNAVLDITFLENANDDLPATHIIEISVTGELAASSIKRIPGIARSATERSSLDTFVGEAVAVTEDVFWITLSDRNQLTETKNLQLLRYGLWFSLPILFQDGSHALLTFERGKGGAEIFADVLSAWEEN